VDVGRAPVSSSEEEDEEEDEEEEGNNSSTSTSDHDGPFPSLPTTLSTSKALSHHSLPQPSSSHPSHRTSVSKPAFPAAPPPHGSSSNATHPLSASPPPSHPTKAVEIDPTQSETRNGLPSALASSSDSDSLALPFILQPSTSRASSAQSSPAEPSLAMLDLEPSGSTTAFEADGEWNEEQGQDSMDVDEVEEHEDDDLWEPSRAARKSLNRTPAGGERSKRSRSKKEEKDRAYVEEKATKRTKKAQQQQDPEQHFSSSTTSTSNTIRSRKPPLQPQPRLSSSTASSSSSRPTPRTLNLSQPSRSPAVPDPTSAAGASASSSSSQQASKRVPVSSIELMGPGWAQKQGRVQGSSSGKRAQPKTFLTFEGGAWVKSTVGEGVSLVEVGTGKELEEGNQMEEIGREKKEKRSRKAKAKTIVMTIHLLSSLACSFFCRSLKKPTLTFRFPSSFPLLLSRSFSSPTSRPSLLCASSPTPSFVSQDLLYTAPS